jgi:Rad3-related DNA helicase
MTPQVTSKTAFADDLGALLQSYAAVVPMGMLVFFPSYPLMERVLATWHANGRFNKLNSVKQVLSEPHSKVRCASAPLVPVSLKPQPQP